MPGGQGKSSVEMSSAVPDSGSDSQAGQLEVGGLPKEQTLGGSKRTVEEEACRRNEGQKTPKDSPSQRLEVQMLLAPVNSGNSAEKFRLSRGSVSSVQCIALGNQQCTAISVTRFDSAPENAMNEEAPVALVENYITDGDAFK